jgi:proton-translocating NADH-quinone oxidoreductase chain N
VNFVQNIPAISILLPMLVGVITLVLQGRTARRAADITISAVVVMSVLLLAYFWNGAPIYTYSMGHYGAPLGNELRGGILEAAMAVLFSLVTLLSLMGGRNHLRSDIGRHKVNLYYISVLFLLSSMLALTYTNDLFTAYVFIEINTITACGIIMSKEDRYTLAASMRYLIMSLLGSGLFLIGLCLVYGFTGHLLMPNIQEAIRAFMPGAYYTVPLQVAIALFAVGLALKSALWPFHSWLPDAHSSASAASSAILSGLVLKSFIFLLIKIFYRTIGVEVISGHAILNLFLVFGILGMLMGSINALFEKDIKRMLAFSSVSQIGYIFCGLGIGTTAGIIAALVQVTVHATTKALLFIAAGGLMDASGGSKKYKDLVGAGRRDLFAGIAFIVGTFSMIGIPFFGGFITKLTLVTAAAECYDWRMYASMTAIIVSTILTAIYYIRILSILFRNTAEEEKDEASVLARRREFKVHLRRQLNFDTEYIVATVIFIIINLSIGLQSDQLVFIIKTGLATFQ